MDASEETTTTARCRRCRRPLRSAKSITAGMGRTCAKRTRQDAAATFKPALVAKAHELIEQGGIVALRGRRIFRTVSSDGERTYLTAPEACNCPAGLRAKHICFHRVAVILKAA
ncbi:MAG: hypothetical protein JWN00_1458 [Actinomycetia bacterium]|nr:hypothetical protein [Actinomycetes bacterium]